jgi:exonuclease SbcC
VKPLRLTLTGVRSYAGTCSIDFTGKRLLAILGNTGVGKSTILEAIIFALYGTCSWSKHPKAAYELIGKGCPSMDVAFEFSANGREWSVRRTLHADRKRRPQALLEPLAEDSADLRVDGKDAVTQAVTRIIGLDWDGFVSTVLLRQGKFDTLLKAPRAMRADILRHIFGINELERVRKRAGVRLERLNADRRGHPGPRDSPAGPSCCRFPGAAGPGTHPRYRGLPARAAGCAARGPEPGRRAQAPQDGLGQGGAAAA